MLQRLALVLTCSALAPAAWAQDSQQPSETKAVLRRALESPRGFRQLKVPGTEVAKAVGRLKKEMRWHKTLSGALATGRAQGKPVVFIQALGDLDGFL